MMFTEGGTRICSPELLSQIAEVIDSAVIITRFGNLGQFDHRIIYANPAFAKLTGYKQSEVVGRSPDILCDPRTSGDKILEFYSRATKGGKFSLEMGSFRKAGGELTLNIDVTPVIDETQGTHYYILNLKAVEAAAEKAEAEPQEEYVAPVKRHEPEHKEEHHRPHHHHEPLHIVPEHHEEPVLNERFWQSPNNDPTPHNEGLDQLREFVGMTNKHIAHLAKAEQLKAGSPAAELSTDESIAEYCKTQFLANMSHDLRTPLNAIIGFSEVIKDQLFGPIENPRYVSYASDIFRSGQELLATISEIMELSEIQPDENVDDGDRMNICDIIESVIEVLSPKAFAGDVKILKSFDARDLKLTGDRRKIKQAIAGVVGNAIKYSAKGSKIEIGASITEKGDLKISVYAKTANIINTKAAMMGSLSKKMESEYPEISLAKKFIEAHDGKFAIFNSQTAGTEISIILPASRLTMEQEKKTLLKVIS